MPTYYSAEKNVQILIALLKAHGVRKIVASPGATNVCFVASLRHDDYFEMYSAVDERSAGYMACGLAAESGEPVVITCTQATASRNYLPALTEAYYRKLPVLAVTSTRHESEVGHRLQQVIDQSVMPKDTVKLSVSLPFIRTPKDQWACEVNANRALLELSRHGGGPVHIRLCTEYTNDFTVRTLPPVRKIMRYFPSDDKPVLRGRVGIFVASHVKWPDELTCAVDSFCERYDAVVLCDQTSNYRGRYGIMEKLVTNQKLYHAGCNDFDTIIHIGDMSGSYLRFNTKNVWRVSADGELCDAFGRLEAVFEMDELTFFSSYLEQPELDGTPTTALYGQWREEYDRLAHKANAKKDELPFSNAWIAQQTLPKLPESSVLHLGIYNTLRTWSFFEGPASVLCYANVGGFGIDGNLSSLLGASLADPNRLYFGVVGDLAFFYDMNSLGNRHVAPNIRILLVNNGRGTEFTNKDNFTYQAGIGPEAVSFIAAENHYGNQSRRLVRHYAEDLGFEYLSASDKSEYLACLDRFVMPLRGGEERPVVLEVFTDSADERDALEMLYTLEDSVEGRMKQAAKEMLGRKRIGIVKKIIGR